MRGGPVQDAGCRLIKGQELPLLRRTRALFLFLAPSMIMIQLFERICPCWRKGGKGSLVPYRVIGRFEKPSRHQYFRRHSRYGPRSLKVSI
ncbi:hypothetical protein EV363DRAFT_1160967 [Boletus edulis]|uniref:Uncharacterized protein n=1 Tax=Boletus edulis BED1 TaxID=1328754 RepID=A0AAD4C0T3_BOLED|nr:hypothetical protein EV363DRAFT_1160967 [Boletus edulis]KAF8444790.1 hypothetical protein L210DRAFT_650341 [Boletus edulis BED1]